MALISHYNKSIQFKQEKITNEGDAYNVIVLGEVKSGKTTIINKLKKLILNKEKGGNPKEVSDIGSNVSKAGRFTFIEMESLTKPLVKDKTY